MDLSYIKNASNNKHDKSRLYINSQNKNIMNKKFQRIALLLVIISYFYTPTAVMASHEVEMCSAKKERKKSKGQKKSKILVVAHRGASAYAAENSLEAFKLGFEMNSDAIELDIWTTTDDSLVVMHDRTTGRTADKNLAVPESTAEQLRLVSLKNGEPVPYVYEALELVPKDKKIVIEIKNYKEKGSVGTVFPMLSDLLKRTGKVENAIIISFGKRPLIEAKKHLPDTKCYYLSSKKDIEDELIELCLKHQFDGLNVSHKIITESLYEKTQKAGLELLTWTVDEEEVIERVMDKVSVITTNKPDTTRETLNKHNK